GTARAGLAGTQAAVIKAAGYSVPTVGNAPSQGYAKTVIVDLSNGANPNTKKYLETTYGVTAVTQLPDPAIQPGSANFVVILGSDQVH
ncbi:MAG: LytR C-terminal domain-containing protein, partial [Candidatus Saccharimonadales bacterium]